MEQSKKFNIQLAAQLSGLSTHTIRAWEKRYSAVTPERNEFGRRLYTSDEIDRLVLLSELTRLGTSIGQIANLPMAELLEIKNKLLNTHLSVSARHQEKNSLSIQETKDALYQAVGEYQVDKISQILTQSKSFFDPKTFALEIISPLITEVKKRTEQNQYQDAQAQALFALVKFHAGNIIYAHFEKSIKSKFKIVLTSVEKEHHTFPLLISALLCCYHKKHFYYLNSNLPAESIIDATRATEADLLILSVPPHLLDKEEIIDEVFHQLSSNVKIWLLADSSHQETIQRKWKGLTHIHDYYQLEEALCMYP